MNWLHDYQELFLSITQHKRSTSHDAPARVLGPETDHEQRRRTQGCLPAQGKALNGQQHGVFKKPGESRPRHLPEQSLGKICIEEGGGIWKWLVPPQNNSAVQQK